MNKSIITCSLFVICSMASCIGFKNNASKKSKAYYETFFINDSTLQYFIKPIQYKGQFDLQIDFTFRKSRIDFSDVTMNFSIFSNTPSSLEEMSILPEKSINSKHVTLLFKEKKKDNYIYRYTAKIPYSSLKDFFSKKYPNITYNDYALAPTPKSKKIITLLDADLFNFELVD